MVPCIRLRALLYDQNFNRGVIVELAKLNAVTNKSGMVRGLSMQYFSSKCHCLGLVWRLKIDKTTTTYMYKTFRMFLHAWIGYQMLFFLL